MWCYWRKKYPLIWSTLSCVSTSAWSRFNLRSYMTECVNPQTHCSNFWFLDFQRCQISSNFILGGYSRRLINPPASIVKYSIILLERVTGWSRPFEIFKWFIFNRNKVALFSTPFFKYERLSIWWIDFFSMFCLC